jgi:plastocyanin
VNASRATASLLLVCALGLLSAASGSAALGASGDPSHSGPSDPSHRGHLDSGTARACHCNSHGRCRDKGPRATAEHQHARCDTRKHSASPLRLAAGSAGAALITPWASLPTPSALSPATGSGTSPATTPGSTPPVESPATPIAPARVEVTAEDSEAFRFALSRPTVPAGRVIIEFVNHGQDEHNLNAVEPSAGSVAGSIPNTAPNAHPSVTLNLRPGSYTLFCSIADHEAKGMKATLVVD